MFNLPPLPRTLRACEEDLRSKAAKVRLAVTADLARVPHESERKRRVELLVGALSDPEHTVRRGALVALADLSATEAASAIVRCLGDPEIQVRQMAVLALGETASPEDEDILGRLASLLRAGDPAIRYQALLAHSNLRPDLAAEDLERASGDEDPEVRELSLRLVEELLLEQRLFVPPSLERAVQAACHDPSSQVALVAQLVAAEMKLQAPTDWIQKVVRREATVREPRDEQSAIRFAGQLRIETLKPALRKRAFGVFGMSFDPFRWVALSALASLGDDAAIARLMKALVSGSFVERTLAAQGLGDSGRIEAVAPMRELLGRETIIDQRVLGAALENLARSVRDRP